VTSKNIDNAPDAADFLNGGGEMGALIRAHDWSGTAIGLPATWPAPLRTALRILLTTNHPIFVFWGPELICFYNDAYRQSVGPEKHPSMLGARGRDMWVEIWDIIGPQIDFVMAGRGATWHEDALVPIVRHGGLEQVYWTYGYGPIDDASAPNNVGGVLVICTETTSRMRSERRTAFLLTLTDRLRALSDARDIVRTAAEMLGRHLDATRVGYGEVNVTGDTGSVEIDWCAPGTASLAGRHRLDDFGPKLMDELRAGRVTCIEDALTDPLTEGERYAPTYRRIGARAGINVPLVKNGRFVALLYVHQPLPRKWTAEETTLALDTAERTWDALERAHAESQLRQNEARWRGLFAQAPAFMATLTGPAHVFEYVNAGYMQLVGQRDILGKPIREALPELEGQGYYELLDEVFRTGKAFTGRSLPVDLDAVGGGTDKLFLDFIYQPILDEAGAVNGILVQGYDVTVRVDVEQALRTSEDELRRLNSTLEQRVQDALAERELWAHVFESASATVAALDTNFRLLAMNRAYAAQLTRVTGHVPNLGDSLLDLLAAFPHAQDSARVRWSRALRGEEYTITEQYMQGIDTEPTFDITYTSLRDPDGRLIGAFQYAYDVSQRVRDHARLAEAEDALRQSQKMEAVGQLTGGIAHDFNNLLTGIIGSLDMMQRRLVQGRTVDVNAYANAAMTAANRAAALTHRLLAFSRRQTLDPKPTNANRLVTGMEELLRRTMGESIDLEIVTAAGLWLTRCDPHQLENAVLNLAINARDAMPDGGKLTIETANVHMDETHAATARNIAAGQYVAICVTDTGTGMTPDIVSKAFDPFFTTKPIGQGTGLGLSMIYGFTRQSDGYAMIYSEVGQGTTVKLYLPRYHGSTDRIDEPTDTATEPPQSLKGEVVLVVEDERVVRDLVIDVLRELGYRVLEAVDGPSGLQIIESEARVDLLVTDIGLPGLNGHQLADAARRRRAGLKILFITGYAHNAAMGNRSLEPGTQIITKPFAIETFASRVRQMLAS
jgi:signal transduction histidine kinase